MDSKAGHGLVQFLFGRPIEDVKRVMRQFQPCTVTRQLEAKGRPTVEYLCGWHYDSNTKRVAVVTPDSRLVLSEVTDKELRASQVCDWVCEREWLSCSLRTRMAVLKPSHQLHWGGFSGTSFFDAADPVFMASASLDELTLQPAQNARYDRLWRFFTWQDRDREQRCPVVSLPASQSRPAFTLTLWPTKGAEFDAASITAEQFALWECSEAGPERSVSLPFRFETKRGADGKPLAFVLEPEQKLQPKRMYCYSVNDWQLHEAAGASVTARYVAQSVVGQLLPPGVLSVIAGYLTPPPAPPLVRMRLESSTEQPFETLGGWRVFVQVAAPMPVRW